MATDDARCGLYVFKSMDFVLQMIEFVLQMMDCVLKMMDFNANLQAHCIQLEASVLFAKCESCRACAFKSSRGGDLCIQNDDFGTKHDECCITMMNFVLNIGEASGDESRQVRKRMNFALNEKSCIKSEKLCIKNKDFFNFI